MSVSFPKEWVNILIKGKYPEGFAQRNAPKNVRVYSSLKAEEIFCFVNKEYFLRIFLVQNGSDRLHTLIPEYFQKTDEAIAFDGDFIDANGCARMFCLQPISLQGLSHFPRRKT